MYRKISIKLITLTLLLCILFSSIFSAYNSSYSVKAETDTVSDIICDIVLLACTVGGCVVSGGTMTPLAFATAVAMSAKLEGDIFDFCSDNGDGTATISSDTIQMILDSSAYHIAEDGFCTDDIKGYSSANKYPYYAYISGSQSAEISLLIEAKMTSNYLIAGYTTGSSISTNGTTNFKELKSPYFEAIVYRNGEKNSTFNMGGGSGIGIRNPTVLCGNFPIFDSVDKRDNFLKSGNGYESAINYNPNKVNKLKYGTNYSPTYKGGNKTFNINRC